VKWVRAAPRFFFCFFGRPPRPVLPPPVWFFLDPPPLPVPPPGLIHCCPREPGSSPTPERWENPPREKAPPPRMLPSGGLARTPPPHPDYGRPSGTFVFATPPLCAFWGRLSGETAGFISHNPQGPRLGPGPPPQWVWGNPRPAGALVTTSPLAKSGVKNLWWGFCSQNKWGVLPRGPPWLDPGSRTPVEARVWFFFFWGLSYPVNHLTAVFPARQLGLGEARVVDPHLVFVFPLCFFEFSFLLFFFVSP